MPLEGSLRELSLTNIIQLNCNEMNTATVCLTHEDQEGLVCFADGAIVHAEAGHLIGEEAVYELLSWPDGSFVVRQGEQAPRRTISSNWNSPRVCPATPRCPLRHREDTGRMSWCR